MSDPALIVHLIGGPRELGKTLRLARQMQGLTQDGVASLAGITRTALVNIEAGKTGVSFKSLEGIASALGYTVELTFREDPSLR